MKHSKINPEAVSYIFVALCFICLAGFVVFATRSDFSVNLPAWRIQAAGACGLGVLFFLLGFFVVEMVTD